MSGPNQPIVYPTLISNAEPLLVLCGPTKIYVGPPSKDEKVKRICINKLRQRSQDYYQEQRKKKGLPGLVRNPRHRLSEIDTKKLRAVCAVCGLTDIQKAGREKSALIMFALQNRRKILKPIDVGKVFRHATLPTTIFLR